MSKKRNKPLILIGGGGHSSVLADILLSQKRDILAIISPDDITGRQVFSGISQLYNDADITQFDPEEVLLVNAIGMLPNSNLRERVNNYYLIKGYKFETVVADSAYISPYAELGEGVQVFAHSIVQTGAVIGAHTIINSGALIEHDCKIGKYNHIAPRSTLCGQVITEKNVYIGAGSTVLQNRVVSAESIVGAGVVLASDLSARSILYPARPTVKQI